MNADVIELWPRCPCCAGSGQVELERATWTDATGRSDSVAQMGRCLACKGWGFVPASQAWTMRRGEAA